MLNFGVGSRSGSPSVGPSWACLLWRTGALHVSATLQREQRHGRSDRDAEGKGNDEKPQNPGCPGLEALSHPKTGRNGGDNGNRPDSDAVPACLWAAQRWSRPSSASCWADTLAHARSRRRSRGNARPRLCALHTGSLPVSEGGSVLVHEGRVNPLEPRRRSFPWPPTDGGL